MSFIVDRNDDPRAKPNGSGIGFYAGAGCSLNGVAHNGDGHGDGRGYGGYGGNGSGFGDRLDDWHRSLPSADLPMIAALRFVPRRRP